MQHYRDVDPNKAWTYGRWAWAGRLRTLIPAVGANLAGGLISFFFQHWDWGIGLLGLAAALAFPGYLIRYFYRTQIKLEQSLHRFLHECRDHIQRLGNANDDAHWAALVDQFHEKALRLIVDYYRYRSNDDDVGAAIRLAERIDEQDCYVTKARVNLDPSRQHSSEPLPFDKGLANALREQESQGVFVIDDVHKAAKQAGWFETRNDKLDDVRAQLAAPINGWDGDSKSMFGILYVSSKAVCAFNPSDTEAMKMFADALGTFYAMFLFRYEPSVRSQGDNG